MRLTKIKLAGFKSFPDPVTISLPGRRVGVAGPNGCGKSNLIDAVRWVLGESSAKQLRGEQMQDVIFNGASGRRPAARASVELVFDNSAGSLKGAWGQYAEIAVKRQLTRQGESGYFINGQAVRRRDITELFLGTGAGARGYAVIEQGMIARIIEARPEELRAHLEEAAGIAKYKERRRETEARLKDTREHLQRLHDLQSELARQLDKLAVQAQAAARYQTLQNELARSRNLADFLQWQYALADADKADARRLQAAAEKEQAETACQELADTLSELHRTEQAQQQHRQSLAREHALLREQSVRLEEQIRAERQRRERAEQQRAAALARTEQLARQQRDAEAALAAAEAALPPQQNELAAAEARLEELAEALPEYEQQAEDGDAAAREAEAAAREAQSQTALLAQNLRHHEQTLQHWQQRLAQLQAEADRLPENPSAADAEAAAHTAARLNECEQSCLALTERVSQSEQGLQTAAQQRDSLQRQHLALTARRDTLAALLPPADDFWQHAPSAPELHRSLHIAPAWRQAAAAVLRDRVYSRLLPEDFVPPQPLPASRAAWVQPAEAAPPHPQSLLQHIRAEAVFLPALQYWLGDVLCADSLNDALARRAGLRNAQSFVTPEGHRIDRHSVQLYRADAADRAAHLLEHRQLQQQILELEQPLAEAEAAHAEAAQTLAGQRAALEQAQHRRQTLSAQLLREREQQAEQRAQAQHAEQRRRQIAADTAAAQAECDTLSHTLDTLLEQQQNQADAAREQQSAAETCRQRSHAARQRLEQHRRDTAAAEARRQSAADACRRLQQQCAHLRQQQQQLAEQITHWRPPPADAVADSLFDDPEAALLRLETLNGHAETLEQRLQEAQAQADSLHRQYQSRQAEQQQWQNRLPALQEAVQTALLQQQEALLQAKHHHAELTARAADLDALAAEAPDADSPAALKRRVQRLQQDIEALGAVNLAALQELEEARQRDAYYRSQNEDICAAAALLEEAIARINAETKSRFQATFDAVNAKMQSIFPTLFGGGEACLQLDGSDALHAGVMISARPPGKKNSTIHLLSGGEKALTAMSLVFALFSLNPAPFCLLDEVDAPLDDANTARFCDLVRQMSAATQFLYISHNRLTMEMAEQLIGVTMQEKGVSRIVAVDLEKAADLAQAA